VLCVNSSHDKQCCVVRQAIMPVSLSHASSSKTIQNSVYLGYSLLAALFQTTYFAKKIAREAGPPSSNNGLLLFFSNGVQVVQADNTTLQQQCIVAA
jgi:hypothetical protein